LEGRCKLVFRAEGLKLSEDRKHLKGLYRHWIKEKQQIRQLLTTEARRRVR
jgi:hypothetical protein